jgi:tetratricopeptide (TPR) repeat protein
MEQGLKWGAILAGVVLVIAGGMLFLRPHTAALPSSTPSGVTAISTATTTQRSGGVAGNISQPVTIRQVPATAVFPTHTTPDVNHEPIFSANLSSDAVSQLSKSIAALQKELATQPTKRDLWLSLALNYKIAGDYKAAEEVWIYLTKTASDSHVAFANLGDLYQNFQRDYPKAEASYLDVYRNLYVLYRYQYKTTTTAARDILERGLVANPRNPDLLALKEQLEQY